MTVGAGTATTRTDTILDRIVADKRVELEETRRRTPLAQLEARIAGLPAALPFAGRLRGTRLQLIAEIKKASPAKGLLEADLDPVARATTYAAGGAAAISVLTESSYFQGSLDHLAAVRASFEAAPARPALLRKDFLFDPYQVYEARAAGADALLLIAAILPDGLLADLLALARAVGVGVLLEVHDEAEMARALRTDAEVIGVNNRDLRTFVTDLAVTERLLPLLPPGRVAVSESGIHTRADAERVRAAGATAILVGEALMTSADITGRMRELMV